MEDSKGSPTPDCSDSQNVCPMKRQRLNSPPASDAESLREHRPIESKTNRVEEPGSILNNHLREFQVLDEVQSDGSGEENASRDSDYNESSDMDLDVNELDSMLEEGLPDELKSKQKPSVYEEKFKVVVEEKSTNHFEVLPENWVQVTHNSGMPLYLHKGMRVCTLSRPYFLGPGSVRRHEIPLSAIPCFSYRRALEKEKEEEDNEKKKQVESSQNQAQNTVASSSNENSRDDAASEVTEVSSNSTDLKRQLQVPNAKIETVKENFKKQSLTANEVQDYCKKLFKFKTIRFMRFNSWSARRRFIRSKKHIKNLQRPSLPDGTKLITFPVLNSDDENGTNKSRTRKEWTMNPNGKSYICILHEYVQHALKKQPMYEFKELENAATPYSATVTINNIKYGTGYGTSKKQAKTGAARETLEILIPEMRDKIMSDKSGNTAKSSYKDLSVFDEIKIQDPRVAEFCAKTTEPSPHSILLTCLQRNYGLGDVQIKYEVNAFKNKKNEFTMTVGNHTATVVCKNKREGKQLASQAILQTLHPHIKTWGSLLRLYGSDSVKSSKEKKQEEQEITVLQGKAALNQPNHAILDKLRTAMLKLAESRDAIKPIGTLIAPSDAELPTASSSNLNNVAL